MSEHPQQVRLAVAGTIATLLLGVFAGYLILVMNPPLMAPDLTLSEIYSELSASSSFALGQALMLVALAPVLAVLYLSAVFRLRHSCNTVIAVYLGLVMMSGLAYLAASYRANATIANIFEVATPEPSSWSWVIYTASFLALAALVFTIGQRSADH